MPWRGATRGTCKVCQRERRDDELFSARGKCPDCGDGLALANSASLAAHRGPHFERWRRAHAAAVGAVLLDDLPAKD